MNKSEEEIARQHLGEIKKLGRNEQTAKQLEKLVTDFSLFLPAWIELGLTWRTIGDRNSALLVFTKAQQLKPENLQVKLELAVEQLHFDRIAKARENIEEVLKVNPQHAWALIRLGEVYRQESNRVKAKECYQKAVESEPKNLWANINLAVELRELGLFSQAEEQLKKTLEYHPNQYNILIQLGELSKKRERLEEAIAYFEKAEKIEPNNPQPGIKIAEILRSLSQFDAAEDCLKKLQQKHPDNFSLHIQLGQLERQRGRREQALNWFNLAKEIASNPIQIKDAQLLAIEELRDLNRLDEALEAIKIILKHYSEDIRAKLIHVSILRRQAKFSQVREILTELLEIERKNIVVKLELARNFNELGKNQEAIAFLEAESQENNDNRILLELANFYQQKPDLVTATKLYRQILNNEPNNLSASLELAKTLSQSGEVHLAIELLKKAYKIHGAKIPILLQLGQLSQALEDWETARKYYQQAYENHPSNPNSHCRLANLMFLQGEIEAAFNLLQQARELLPNATEIPLQLANFEQRLGNLDNSYNNLDNALQRFPKHVPLLLQLTRLLMQKGDFDRAIQILNEINTERKDWLKQIQQIRAEIAFACCDFSEAEACFHRAINLSSTAHHERMRLAFVLMLTGRIDAAREQLNLATEELYLKTTPGKSLVPLRSHPAMVINAIRINPPLMASLQEAGQETGQEKLIALGKIMAQDASYLGSALYLARELRQQGVFDRIRAALSIQNTNLPTIPKRIVQFWHEPEPPAEVQKLNQSWLDFNPEYEYIRFSLTSAIAFLAKYYDDRVLKAFANCEQPATQADFFRLAYLNQMGGFYADADDKCRQSLDTIISVKPELVVYQEDFACIGNNFLGCIPGQTIIRTAFYQAVSNLLDYSAENPWFKTGPGLLTSKLCSGLIPYLSYTDYQLWPRFLVLSQAQLKSLITPHVSLPYKNTKKSWHNNEYQRKISGINLAKTV